MELERLVATFNAAGVEGRNGSRRKQVALVLHFADSELKKRTEDNAEYVKELQADPERIALETIEIAEIKKRSLECDRLLRSKEFEDSKHAAEVADSFEWVTAGLTNLCMLRKREDLLDIVNASA